MTREACLLSALTARHQKQRQVLSRRDVNCICFKFKCHLISLRLLLFLSCMDGVIFALCNHKFAERNVDMSADIELSCIMTFLTLFFV